MKGPLSGTCVASSILGIFRDMDWVLGYVCLAYLR